MNGRSIGIGVALGALLVIACGESTPVEPVGEIAANRGLADQELPLRWHATGALLSQNFAPDFGPPDFGKSDFAGRCSAPSDFLISFSIDGQGTHLGDFSGRAEHCTLVNFQTGESSWQDGVIVLIAANGDELWGSYASVGEFPSGVPFTELMEFTGGTGRFAGATGGGIDQASCNRTTGLCTLEMDGEIAYDASRRRR